jgi:hypothetical protein
MRAPNCATAPPDGLPCDGCASLLTGRDIYGPTVGKQSRVYHLQRAKTRANTPIYSSAKSDIIEARSPERCIATSRGRVRLDRQLLSDPLGSGGVINDHAGGQIPDGQPMRFKQGDIGGLATARDEARHYIPQLTHLLPVD